MCSPTPGWVETYGAGVLGQKLDVEAVPDGAYALRSVADPRSGLVKSDGGNNDAFVYLRIDRDKLEEIRESS